MNKEIMAKLTLPFKAEEIEWRVQREVKTKNGLRAVVLAYVTNRAIQDRFDDVFGVLNWKNEFKEWKNGSQLCGISVWDQEKKEWITKWDGADDTKVENTKGGLSDSMKRAAVQWGVGRYLYNLKENWVELLSKNSKAPKLHKGKDGNYYKWQPPKLPDWALPSGEIDDIGKEAEGTENLDILDDEIPATINGKSPEKAQKKEAKIITPEKEKSTSTNSPKKTVKKNNNKVDNKKEYITTLLKNIATLKKIEPKKYLTELKKQNFKSQEETIAFLQKEAYIINIEISLKKKYPEDKDFIKKFKEYKENFGNFKTLEDVKGAFEAIKQ